MTAKRKRSAKGKARPRRGRAFSADFESVSSVEKRATTSRVTPTKRGFASMSKQLGKVQQAQRVRNDSAFSFRISGQYRSTSGKLETFTTQAAGFPTARSVRKNRRKGESEAQAFRRLTVGMIRGAVFRSISQAEGIAHYPGTGRGKKMSKARALKALNAFKKRRGVSFRVTVERDV